MNVLVVASHPDDEVLGCGATIKKHVNDGDTVDVAILGEGITSRYDNRDDADIKEIEELQERSRKVANKLGINNLFQHKLPDNRFDNLDLLDIVKKVEVIIEKSNPQLIYTHYRNDLNIDHQITSRAVLTATRPLKETTVDKILSFEVPSSTEWSFNSEREFSPDFFVDVSREIKEKINAMELYESEFEDFPHPRSKKALLSLSEHRGSTVGFQHAEAFETVRILKD